MRCCAVFYRCRHAQDGWLEKQRLLRLAFLFICFRTIVCPNHPLPHSRVQVSVYSCTAGSEIRVKHLFVDENVSYQQQTISIREIACVS